MSTSLNFSYQENVDYRELLGLASLGLRVRSLVPHLEPFVFLL